MYIYIYIHIVRTHETQGGHPSKSPVKPPALRLEPTEVRPQLHKASAQDIAKVLGVGLGRSFWGESGQVDR